MIRKYNKFAFDLDGTLMDSNGEIINGVVDLFYDILTKVDNPQILICTSNTYRGVLGFLTKLNTELEKKFEKDNDLDYFEYSAPNIAISCYGGSFVVLNNGKGKVIHNQKVTPKQYDRVKNIVEKADKKSIILLNCETGFYYAEPKLLSTDKVRYGVLNALKSVLGFKKFTFNAVKYDDFISKINNNEVYAIDVYCGNSQAKFALKKELDKYSSEYDCSVDSSVQIKNGSKLQSIKDVFNITSGEGVVYIGNGYNDIDAMKFAELSLAVGSKVGVLKSATYALEELADASNVIFTTVDYKDISNKVIAKAEKENGKKTKNANLEKDLV